MRKMLAVAVLALFALGISADLPGRGAEISAEPPMPTPKDAPQQVPKQTPANSEFPKNYQLWMQLSLLADCTAENSKTFLYAVYGSVPKQAMVSLSRKEEQWGSFVYWQDASARYFIKQGDEIRAVAQQDEFTKEVARIAGSVAPSWFTAKDLPKGCALKTPGRKGTLAGLMQPSKLDRAASLAPGQASKLVRASKLTVRWPCPGGPPCFGGPGLP